MLGYQPVLLNSSSLQGCISLFFFFPKQLPEEAKAGSLELSPGDPALAFLALSAS